MHASARRAEWDYSPKSVEPAVRTGDRPVFGVHAPPHRFSEAVISPSQFLLDFYEARGFSASKRILLRNRSRHYRTSGGRAARWHTFLYLGQIEDHKGVLFLLRTLKHFCVSAHPAPFSFILPVLALERRTSAVSLATNRALFSTEKWNGRHYRGFSAAFTRRLCRHCVMKILRP